MSNLITLLLTRFNVPTEQWNKTRDGKPPLTEEWLRDRFELFKKLCLPSFKNQSSQNYIWLVFFDIQTSEEFRQIIADIQKEYPVFTPVFVNDFAEMKQKAIELAPQYCNLQTEYIISAEIDNDDLLHKDYVKTLQELYKPIHNLVMDIRKGYQMSLLDDKKILINEYYVIANPFVAIVEKTTDFQSILKGNHRFYRDYKDVVPYDKLPLFIQTIHGNNLMNDVYETKYLQNPDLQAFAISNLEIQKMKTWSKNLNHYLRVAKKIIKK